MRSGWVLGTAGWDWQGQVLASASCPPTSPSVSTQGTCGHHSWVRLPEAPHEKHIVACILPQSYLKEERKKWIRCMPGKRICLYTNGQKYKSFATSTNMGSLIFTWLLWRAESERWREIIGSKVPLGTLLLCLTSGNMSSQPKQWLILRCQCHNRNLICCSKQCNTL